MSGAKRQCQRTSKGERIQLPRAPGMTDEEFKLMRECKKCWDKHEGEPTDSDSDEEDSAERQSGGISTPEGESISLDFMRECQKLWDKLESDEEDLSIARWLKQESDDYCQLDAKEEVWFKLPQDRKRLYRWLKRSIRAKQPGGLASSTASNRESSHSAPR